MSIKPLSQTTFKPFRAFRAPLGETLAFLCPQKCLRCPPSFQDVEQNWKSHPYHCHWGLFFKDANLSLVFCRINHLPTPPPLSPFCWGGSFGGKGGVIAYFFTFSSGQPFSFYSLQSFGFIMRKSEQEKFFR